MGFFDSILPAVGGLLGGPVGTIASSVIGGVLSKKSVEDTNDTNVDLARMNNQFNAEQSEISRNFSADQASKAMDFSGNQAQRQMDFQERMSNTQYQRAIGDMMQAGLNPMLAYSQGGAGNVSGASGQSSMGQSSAAQGTPVRVENSVLPALAAAAQAASLVASVEKTRAETEEIRARTDTERKRPDNVEWDTNVKRRTETLYNQLYHNRVAEMHLTDEQKKKVSQEIKNLISSQETDAANRLLTMIRAQHGDLDLPRAVNEARAQSSWIKREVSPYLDEIQTGVHSAESISRALRSWSRGPRPWSRETTRSNSRDGWSQYERSE